MDTPLYTIGQLAVASGTKTATIRFYERRGLLASPERSPSGYRIYPQSEVQRLVFIRRCRRFGIDLESIRELLERSDHQDAPCEGIDEPIKRHLKEVQARILELHALEEELRHLSSCCPGGGDVRDCRIVESLRQIT